jgi:hypothetical protein
MGISFKGLTQALGGFITPSPDSAWQMGPAQRRGARGFWDRRTKYSGEQLREIRKRKGVGRPPETWPNRSLGRSLQAWQANRMAAKLPPYMKQHDRDAVAKWWPMPIYQANLAEWHRKPRRKDRAAAT